MSFCLIPKAVDKFKAAITDGTISPDKMASMTSDDRRSMIAGIIGDDSAKEVNALFESKLLLKGQQAGLVNWAKKVAGITPEVRRDIITRIERIDKAMNPKDADMFLNDLVEQKLGIGVDVNTAKKISSSVKEIQTAKSKADTKTGVFPSNSDRLDYGIKYAAFQDYMASMKNNANKLTWKQWLISPMRIIDTITGTAKSAVASMDNSFFGRQGIKMLYTNPDIWAKSFYKSWGDIGKQIFAKGKFYGSGDDAAMLVIKADVYSKPNALNGKYKAGEYAIGLSSEEAYPSSIPEKIPFLGRLFKASETAYNGGALRMRQMYADRVIETAERQGINTLDKTEAKGLGHLVNSLTGRGSIGKLDVYGKEINAGFFSIKFLKSNFDVLTAHTFDKGATKFAKKQAAGNLLKIVTSTAAILGTAEALHPGSVSWDPRSSRFGKIKIKDTTFDVTGGMASIATLISRTMIPTNGPDGWGLYSRNAKGELTKTNTYKYGQQNTLDIVESFWEGKLSPAAGIVRDVWKGQTYSNKPTTPAELLKGVTTPIIIQNYSQLKQPNAADPLMSLILDGLGISTFTPALPKPKKETKKASPKSSSSWYNK